MSLGNLLGVTTHSRLELDRGRLRLFAKATGQTDPVYTDVDAALAAGHRDLLVPPTFLFGVDLERPDPFDWFTSRGHDLGAMLHGTQTFDYLASVYAGDEVTATAVVTDVQVKRGGALTLITRETTVARAEEPVARLITVMAVRAAA